MAIALTAGAQIQRVGGQSIENLAQSTATAQQTIGVTTYVTALAGGTATGDTNNLYVLSNSAPEGTEKLIMQVATGRSSVDLLLATGTHFFGVASATGIAAQFLGAATGMLVLAAKSSWVRVIKLNEAWTVLGGNATFSTGTSTGA